MAKIHPTAVIDPQAEIGAGCEVGPYCIIGPGVVLGADCWLQHHVSLSGPARLGSGNQLYAFASIGQRVVIRVARAAHAQGDADRKSVV